MTELWIVSGYDRGMNDALIWQIYEYHHEYDTAMDDAWIW